MLDIYLIDDPSDIPSDPDEEFYMESMSMAEFVSLQALWTKLKDLGSDWSYFTDSRLDSRQVKMALDILKHQIANDIDVEKSNAATKMMRVLDEAAGKDCGIVAFAD
ncbi:hypothetical protein [Polyangium sorediatum]|uniref:Uncharacterized protein n=1 Tax=Polyangium sorediatum TaxID=889274 RepID=A0ABT6NP94_9BACT|nr:hypothetical protein [Polyangium sorediatum]MDI1430151.1 hypothetical protein [Polyangium sorediatum]